MRFETIAETITHLFLKTLECLWFVVIDYRTDRMYYYLKSPPGLGTPVTGNPFVQSRGAPRLGAYYS